MEALSLFDLPPAPEPPRVETLTIADEAIVSVSPEGKERRAKLADLLRRLDRLQPTGFGLVWPDGVKATLTIPNGLIVVHQTSPRVFGFQWIDKDSQRPFGPGTKYRTVRISLPYVIVLAVFERGSGARLELSGRNECFFMNQPLDVDGLNSELCYPALLNCSKMPAERKTPLAWICSQRMDSTALAKVTDFERLVHVGLRTLLGHLFESGFNRSSEVHEGRSWYSESVAAEIDPRIATVEDWEQATAADPLFVLDVPWIPTGKTVSQVAGLIATLSRERGQRIKTSTDLARLLFAPTRGSKETQGGKPS